MFGLDGAGLLLLDFALLLLLYFSRFSCSFSSTSFNAFTSLALGVVVVSRCSSVDVVAFTLVLGLFLATVVVLVDPLPPPPPPDCVVVVVFDPAGVFFNCHLFNSTEINFFSRSRY